MADDGGVITACDTIFAAVMTELRNLQALLERFPSKVGDARWQPLKQFLAVNPDVRRLNRAMGGRMLDFEPADSVTPRRVRPTANAKL